MTALKIVGVVCAAGLVVSGAIGLWRVRGSYRRGETSKLGLRQQLSYWALMGAILVQWLLPDIAWLQLTWLVVLGTAMVACLVATWRSVQAIAAAESAKFGGPL